jgi:hypothetical protein
VGDADSVDVLVCFECADLAIVGGGGGDLDPIRDLLVDVFVRAGLSVP